MPAVPPVPLAAPLPPAPASSPEPGGAASTTDRETSPAPARALQFARIRSATAPHGPRGAKPRTSAIPDVREGLRTQALAELRQIEALRPDGHVCRVEDAV